MRLGVLPLDQLFPAFCSDLRERPALLSMRLTALSERLPIHSDVQTLAGSGAVAHPVIKGDMMARARRAIMCFMPLA